MTVCFFAARDAGPCDGRLERAHWVPKSSLKREGVTDFDLLWHPCLWTPMCRTHHERFDRRMLPISRDDIPAELVELLAEYDLDWMVDRYYPRSEAA